MSLHPISRRSLCQWGTAAAAMALVGVPDRPAYAAQPVEMQLGWIGGGNQLGEVVALQLGYYGEEGLDFRLIPGGPNNDGIASVASGRSAVGQVSSSPSLMLAVVAGPADPLLRGVGAEASLRLLLAGQEPGAHARPTCAARRWASRRPAWCCCGRCWSRTAWT